MVSHTWGDAWFQAHGEELNKAMNYIYKFHKRATGKHICMKEKYGTIRYEFEWAWLKNFPVFLEILIRATKKYPNVTAEIVEDAEFLLETQMEALQIKINYLLKLAPDEEEYWGN